MATDFDPLDEMLADEGVVTTVKAGRFQPKAKFKPTVKKKPAATSVSNSQASQTVVSTQSELSEPVRTVNPSENSVSGLDVVPNNDGVTQASMEKSTKENSDVVIGSEGLGDLNTSGMETVAPNDLNVPSYDGQDHMHDKEPVREEMDTVNNVLEKDSIPTFQEDIVLDLSSLEFNHTVASSDCPSTEEPVNLLVEEGHEIPAKLASRRAKTGTCNTKTAPDHSPEQQETGRSLRPRKSKTDSYRLVDEDVEVSEECLLEEENINNNEETQVESEPPKKNSKRKSKMVNDDKEKPARKQKKVNEASAKEVAATKPKKFSHSTRRNRVVDRALLMTPEDDFDYQAVPLRDLIARADFIEKQTKKDEAANAEQLRSQSTGNSSGLYNEEETFISKQGREFDDDEEEQGSPVAAADTTEYYNYQTYMDKAPSTRWSKQDTELFYEAVRQFGTDLSMIQMRFPDRERRQLKRKYKKEEREHPIRLRDALTNRTKDLSHLKELVELIKQQEAEEKQEADKDGPIDLTDKEVADKGTLNADGEEPKDEHIQGEKNNDGADDVADEENVDDDDLFDWSQYKSDA